MKEDLEYLFNRYHSNEITEVELYRLFELLSKQQHDEQLKGLLDEVWDRIPQPVPVPQPLPIVRPLRKKVLAWASVAASLLIIAGLGWYFISCKQPAPIALHQEINPAGQAPRKLELPDHSVVWLNAGSSISYLPGFAGKERLVQLEGEACFEVSTDAHKPFIVKSGAITTMVLGTHFNVQAYTIDKRIAVSVISGLVGIKDSLHLETTPVGSNQEIVYNTITTTSQTHTIEDASREIAWTQGQLVFHNDPITRVVRTLETRFARKIIVAPTLQECVFYGEFAQEPLDKILDMLAASLDGKVEEKDGTFYISGKGCL